MPDIAMTCVETSTHSFIIKVWLEETVEQSGEAKWRGSITHVSSHERRYVESLEAITEFISGYLEAMGVHRGLFQKASRKWLRRLKER